MMHKSTIVFLGFLLCVSINQKSHDDSFLFIPNARAVSASSSTSTSTSTSTGVSRKASYTSKQKKPFGTQTLKLTRKQKKIQGTRTTGVGSRRIEKSIFYKKHHLKPVANFGHGSQDESKFSLTNTKCKLYVEMKQSKLIFYTVESRREEVDGDEIIGAVSLSYEKINSTSGHVLKTELEPHLTQFPKSSSDEWIEIEGIYGLYMLPSGPHIVLIYESENVYTSSLNAANASHNIPFLDLRKVLKMEIARVPFSGTKDSSGVSLTVIQRKEEERQLRLLRASFREHGLFFTPLHRHALNSRSESVVHDDVTHNLQRTFLLHDALSTQDSTHSETITNETNGNNEGINLSENNKDNMNTTKSNVPPSSRTKFVWSTSDSRFFWNEDLIRPFLPPSSNHNYETQKRTQAQEQLLRWIIPCTSAFVGIQVAVPLNNSTMSNNTTYDLLLISRRSRYRAGTRFTMRGADATGSVANYAETEQIIILNDGNGEIYSHIQTRGSIPLRWSSPADVKTYAPRVRIGLDPLSQARALRRHLVEQLTLYSHSVPEKESSSVHRGSGKAELVFCNLVDKKGDQGRLGRAFDSVLKAVLDVYNEEPIFSYGVEHIWYDFHAEAKGGKWYKLKSLLEQIRPSLDTHQYFSARGLNICSLQRGVVRTNCMDCLDRTNVIQSLFARYVIFHQLYNRLAQKERKGRTMPLEYVVAYKKEPLTLPWKEGEKSHREVWADNADTISNLYAGTNALKGDFTRTGQRTKKGMIDDGVNSVTRYYLNNFADAMRQEGYDLMTGCTSFSFVKENNYQESERKSDENDRELHLRWLPGDLKSHTISESMGTESGKFFESKDRKVLPSPLETEALAAIDHRAASDRPWWAMEEDEKIVKDDGYEHFLMGKDLNRGISSTGRSGVINMIGAILMTMNAPIITATMIMFILGSGLLSLVSAEENKNRPM